MSRKATYVVICFTLTPAVAGQIAPDSR